MRTQTYSALISLAFFGVLAGCGGSSSGALTPPASPPPPPPPPPAAPMSAAGIWSGQAITPDVEPIFTSFEFDDSDGFILGDAPFTAAFQGGVTKSVGTLGLYDGGVFSWHVDTLGGSIDFAIPGDSLLFSVRTVTASHVATIRVLDEIGNQISATAVTNAFQPIVENRNPGEALIGSVVITVTIGEIVIDNFTFGYPSTASTDDIDCLFAPNDDFVCVLTDATTGDLIGGANGTYQVNGDQVTGAGNLYAAPEETLADGSTTAPLTITTGTVEESDSLGLTVDSTGLSRAVTSLFDVTYDRGADLATVQGMYSMSEILGEMTSFDINGGVISGQTASACVLSGTVAVIDTAANTYEVNLVADAATCPTLSGNYNGLGTSQDSNAMATDDAFIFAVFVDGVSMIVGQAVK